ncbi:Daunorubicin/doxorubicin resistance ATP-binding protein DrrA [Polystyrenella longa]|uniref:Daunorubicin/doxorubicin resistance ATP-binding protein DrrA n=1 Tax=Polystyrenella longa TaxID=2528007 RepID=A0A518CHJ9_9PLAN|nr:ABC transporter ATP-binding protein [Polystyrenella longa]QDU78706.1 Daunorubicin/doxorubicin resistance ATP-binding protein DrrA [Polystyrenella longa]
MIEVRELTHFYGSHCALKFVSLTVASGSILGILGPNGSGKTTLFRILSTLYPVQQGEIVLDGTSLVDDPAAIRHKIGVTFQAPSLDPRLTVEENLRYQGYLYGLSGRALRSRIEELMQRLKLSDRLRDRVQSLSGGMQRRVEIAKGLLHDPQILILDEPSTGLDPGARIDLWAYLQRLRDESGMTILVTTHLMEEAERCDQLAILDKGEVAATGSPEHLRRSLGGDCLTIQTEEPQRLQQRIKDDFDLQFQLIGESLRLEAPEGHELLRNLVDAYTTEIQSVSLGKPTLEDVFIARTGHQFWGEVVEG